MPDSSPFMMSQEQRERTVAWYKDKWSATECPHCNTRQWILGPNLITLRAVHPLEIGNLDMGAPVYPCIVLTCGNCGYTALVNAITSGIVLKEGPNASK